MFKVPETYRWKSYSSRNDGNNGAFLIPRNNKNVPLKVIASDGQGWEHVSVSLPNRCPSWEEMCKVKDLFWDPEDVVVQFHARRSEYVNDHPNCLHLWRPTDKEFKTPSPFLVGLGRK